MKPYMDKEQTLDAFRRLVADLLARFWSRSNDVDGRSLEIIGLSSAAIPDRKRDQAFEDSWIPQALREEYEDWITEEW